MPGRGRSVALAFGTAGLAVVIAAVIALRGRIAEELAIRRLDSKDPATRREAARYLGEIRSVRAVPGLIGTVQAGGDIEEEVIALCRIGPEGRRALLGWRSPDFTPSLVRRLGTLKAEEAVPVLIAGLRVTSARNEASLALERFGPDAAPELLGCLGDPTQGPAARSAAAMILGRMRARRALPVLEGIARNRAEHDEVRSEAFEAIDVIEDRPPAPAVELRMSSAEGEPRSEVAVEIRADLARPLRAFTLDLQAPAAAARFLGVDLGGTASLSNRDAVIFESRGSTCILGLDLSSRRDLMPIETGKDILLIKVHLRIEPDAPLGDHPVSIAKGTFVGLAAKSLRWSQALKAGSVLQVKPRAGSPAPEAGKLEGAAAETMSRPPPALPEGISAEDFVFWAEDVRVEPGAKGAGIRIFATNPVETNGFSMGLRIDPKAAPIRELSIAGTASERARPDHFLWQEHVLAKGETAAGFTFGVMPRASSKPYPGGADEHAVTVVVDVVEGVAAGTVVPVELGAFGEPPGSSIFSIRLAGKGVTSVPARLLGGLILVGASPIPEPASATAEEVEGPAAGGPGGAEPPKRAILLRWTCPSTPDAVRIERDGVTIAEVRGDVAEYRDRAAGPGPHRYRIYAKKGTTLSFPVTARIGSKPISRPAAQAKGAPAQAALAAPPATTPGK